MQEIPGLDRRFDPALPDRNVLCRCLRKQNREPARTDAGTAVEQATAQHQGVSQPLAQLIGDGVHTGALERVDARALEQRDAVDPAIAPQAALLDSKLVL